MWILVAFRSSKLSVIERWPHCSGILKERIFPIKTTPSYLTTIGWVSGHSTAWKTWNYNEQTGCCHEITTTTEIKVHRSQDLSLTETYASWQTLWHYKVAADMHTSPWQAIFCGLKFEKPQVWTVVKWWWNQGSERQNDNYNKTWLLLFVTSVMYEEDWFMERCSAHHPLSLLGLVTSHLL